MKLNYCENYDN